MDYLDGCHLKTYILIFKQLTLKITILWLNKNHHKLHILRHGRDLLSMYVLYSSSLNFAKTDWNLKGYLDLWSNLCNTFLSSKSFLHEMQPLYMKSKAITQNLKDSQLFSLLVLISAIASHTIRLAFLAAINIPHSSSSSSNLPFLHFRWEVY